MLLSIYKLCAATTFVGLSDDNGLDCIETEIILAQYRMIYTDYLEFAINPAQRLMMHGSSPFVACSHTVEAGYVLNKLNTLHQCGCDIPIHKLSYYKRTYFVKREVRTCLTTPSSWNLFQTQWLPAEIHIRTVHPPCGHA